MENQNEELSPNTPKEDGERDGKLGEDVKIKIPVSKKLENFWYHYKWHTIATVFFVIVAIVVTLQFCSREEYDVYVMYAGDKAISTSKSNPERQQMISAFTAVSSDFDENGTVNVAFKHLYSPDAEELERIKDAGGEVPEKLIYDDAQSMSALLAQSDYYLLFLDKAVFDSCSKTGFLSDVTAFLPEGFEEEKLVRGEHGAVGVKLCELGFYELEGINLLPEDTVVCIKLANAFASDADLATRDEAITVFKKIIAA